MIHPDTKLDWINDRVGHGIVATQTIPQGTMVWVQCQLDIVLTPAQIASMPNAYRNILDIYTYGDPLGNTRLNWDLERYMNHSCMPNKLPIGPHIEITIEDIHPGDEITCDYSTISLNKNLHCCCGHANCRGEIKAEDMLLEQDSWNSVLQQTLKLAKLVPQPLAPFLPDVSEWESFLNGESPIPPKSSYYYK